MGRLFLHFWQFFLCFGLNNNLFSDKIYILKFDIFLITKIQFSWRFRHMCCFFFDSLA